MEEGRSDVRVSLREHVCVILIIACILILKNKSFLFLSASWVACNKEGELRWGGLAAASGEALGCGWAGALGSIHRPAFSSSKI